MNINHHLQESDSLGFNDNGKPEPVTWPASQTIGSPAERLLDEIESASNREGKLLVIQNALFDCQQDAAIEAGAAMLRDLIERMDGTPVGAAMRRLALGDGTPVREAAEKAGCSHVWILRLVQQLKSRWKPA